MSWSSLKSLWVIYGWTISSESTKCFYYSGAVLSLLILLWFWSVLKRVSLWEERIRSSFFPWIRRTGHFIYLNAIKLLKCVDTRFDKNFPATCADTSLILVYADIVIKALGWYCFANYVAGPVPIDLPNIIKFSDLKPIPPSFIGFNIWSNTIVPFVNIFFAEQLNFFL